MARTALIVIDMLNPYEHEDAEKLADSVAEQLPQMVELRDRAARAEDTLTIHVNDNYERWECMREDLIRSALDGRRPDLVEPLLPDKAAPFIAKGRHSIFYQTPSTICSRSSRSSAWFSAARSRSSASSTPRWTRTCAATRSACPPTPSRTSCPNGRGRRSR